MDENVRRALQSGLYIVEKNLNRIRNTLQHAEEASVLYSTKDDIEPELKGMLLAIMFSMVEVIKLLKGTFDLQAQQETTRRHVCSYLFENWKILHECKPKRLRGYGELGMQERELLDHHIDKLLAMNGQLQATLLTKSANAPRP